jgi:hypothetical protein
MAVSPPAKPVDEETAATDADARGLRSLMMRFESLGENCEFGLVQRRCGAEPLGLFRFASTPLRNLMAALKARLDGLTDADNFDVELSENGREYMVADRRFGFRYHAWVMAGEMTPEQIRHREARRLPLLVRKLIEDLEHGEKIFVYHGMERVTLEQATALAAILRGFGPGSLLWIELANDDHPAGSVSWAAPGLLKGYMDRLAPAEDAHDLSLECWITICRGALLLCEGRADSAIKGGPRQVPQTPPAGVPGSR